MFDKIGPLQLGIILLIIVMIFGVGKLPSIGADLGKSIRAFKKAQQDPGEEETAAPKAKRKMISKKTQTA